MSYRSKWGSGCLAAMVVVTAAQIARAATLVPIASFTGTNGQFPKAGVIIDSAGNLYGATELGGTSSAGTLFKIAAHTTTIQTLATFNGASMGGLPLGGLLRDNAGNLYGTAEGDGAGGTGTIFELPSGSSTITPLASFGSNGANGQNPYAGLVTDSSGALYGTTQLGGSASSGNVFKLPSHSSTITPVASFDGGLLGSEPQSPLIMDSSGNLYGTTGYGGASGDGLIFKISAGTSTITPLASFSGGNGNNPYGGLLRDSAGNLFGTTANGGLNSIGVIFELPVGSSTIKTLATFNGTNGSSPQAELIEDAAGNLFGTTFSGGVNDDGTVFELPAGSSAIQVLASFNGTNGQFPYSTLVADASGNLYGTTFNGGSKNDGTVFEVTGSGFVVGVPEAGTVSVLIAGSLLLFRRRSVWSSSVK